MFSRLLLIGVLTAAMAATAAGQRGGGGGRGGGMSPYGSGQARTNRLDQMAQALMLNKDQKKDVKNIMDEGQKEAAPLRDQLSKARAQVAAAIGGGKSDEVNQAVKSYADLEAQMAAIELKAFARIFKGLESDQQAKSRTVFTMMSGIFKGKNWMEAE